MKLSVTYLYTIMKYGYPPKPEDDFRAFSEIRKMGFRYLEMEGLGKAHADSVHARLKDYQKALADADIHVHNFCVVDPGLVSPDASQRSIAYDYFRRMAEVGLALGAKTLHLASYAPPVEYAGTRPYQLEREYSFGSASRMIIPASFSWQRVWDTLVESCRRCAGIAKEMGTVVLMEPRVGEVICSVDSMIRLLDDVGMDTLKANFDTGHFSAQREDVCLALMKLEGRFANIHIADNDPRDAEHIAVGDGTIDWPQFFEILRRMGYTGYLGLDLGGREKLVEDLLRSRRFIKSVADQAGVPVTW